MSGDAESRTIREMLLDAVKGMDRDSHEFTQRARAAAEIEITYRHATNDLAKAEEEARSGMILRGVPGTNEAARTAIIKLELARDPNIAALRLAVEKLADEKTRKDMEARNWDVYQKTARAKVAALTALVVRD